MSAVVSILVVILVNTANASPSPFLAWKHSVREQSEPIEIPQPEVVSGESPLHQCARNNQIHQCIRLIGTGQDLEARNDLGQTPFLVAVQEGHLRLSLYFYFKKADVKAQDIFGRTAFHYVVSYHKSIFVSWLEISGSDLDQVDNRGWSPLFLAAAQGKSGHVKRLLKRGANPDFQEHITGMTALMVASWLGREKTLERLLESQADQLLTDHNGNSALHYAADQDKIEVIWAFKDHYIVSQNRDGETPLEIAQKRGAIEVIQALRAIDSQQP